MSLPTTIVDPEKIAWKGEAVQVVLGITDGLVGILSRHADAIFAMVPHVARITLADGTEKSLFISGGVARVTKGELTVIADTAEFPDQIDRERARKAKERAEERLTKGHREINYERARLALMRSLYRLRIAK